MRVMRTLQVSLLVCTLLLLLPTCASASLQSVAFSTPFTHPSLSLSTQCAIAIFAAEYAGYLQPARTTPAASTTNWTQLVADAYQLGPTCNVTKEHVPSDKKRSQRTSRAETVMAHAATIACDVAVYVDGTGGNDSNNGSLTHPVQTIPKALRLTRAARINTAIHACIIIRGGEYYLSVDSSGLPTSTQDSRIGAMIALTSIDSNLTITAYANESVTLSGGVPLTQLQWSIYKTTPNGPIYMASLPAELYTDFLHLNEIYVNDVHSPEYNWRAIPARFPNADPSIQNLHTKETGWIASAQKWAPPRSVHAPTVQTVMGSPIREGTHYPNYEVAIGGCADVFNPPSSYWCMNPPEHNSGVTYAVPSGLTYTASDLPHVNDWINETVVPGHIHVFHGKHWGNWIFSLQSINTTARQITFGQGGWQEARGEPSAGAQWYVANVLAELDAPLEWYVDSAEHMLYFMPNHSTMPDLIIAAQWPCLISIQGSKEDPVTDVVIQGLTLTHTASTYMREYQVPSGQSASTHNIKIATSSCWASLTLGDWSLHVGGTLFLSGTEQISIMNCLFTQLGSNAIVLYGYNLHSNLLQNEIVWTGDSGILLVGNSHGIDAISNTNQPTDTLIESNIIHETGIWVMQSAPIAQTLTRTSTITGNVLFNVPRACININDGFGGGTVMAENLLFNAVRDTNDHGPVNTWDRQPYLTMQQQREDGEATTPSLIPQSSMIHHNFIIMNYASLYPVDHDDGSSYYSGYSNFLVYGGDKSYEGHSKNSSSNLFAYPIHSCLAFHALINDSGWDEYWYNNTCVSTHNTLMTFTGCELNHTTNVLPHTFNNMYYTPAGQDPGIITGCTYKGTSVEYNVTQMQAIGYERDSVNIRQVPTVETVIHWARQLLGV